MHARALLIAALLSAACVSRENYLLPEDPTGEAQTVLYLALNRDDPERAFARAHRVGEPVSLPLSFGPDTELYALYFREPIAVLQLDGELALTKDSTQGRELPGANIAVLSAELAERHLSGWTAAPADALRALYLTPRFDYARFAATGGCLGPRNELILDCPTVQVVPPRPPDRTCPPGWIVQPDPPLDPCVPERIPQLERPTGSTCPIGQWPEDQVFDRYVDDSVPVNGDGSLFAPHRTLIDALAVATPGERIAVARGSYDQPLGLGTPGIALIGACATETVLENMGEVNLAAPGLELRDFTLVNTDIFAGTTTATLADLLFEPADRPGIRTGVGSALSLERVSIRGRTDYGIQVGGGHVHISRSVFEDNSPVSIICDPGVVELEEVYILAGGQLSIAATRCDLSVRRTVLANSSPHALTLVAGDLLLEDTIFDGVSAEPGGEGGIAVATSSTPVATLRRVFVRDVDRIGVRMFDAGHATLEDVTILDVDRINATAKAAALTVVDSGVLEMNRIYVDSGFSLMIGVLNVRSVIADSVVTRANPLGEGGLNFDQVGDATLTRFRIHDSNQTALLIGATTTASIADFEITGAMHGIKLDSANGLGSCTSLSRISIHSRGLEAITVDAGSASSLSDLSIISDGDYVNSSALHLRTQNQIRVRNFILEGNNKRTMGLYLESSFENNLTDPCKFFRGTFELTRGLVRGHEVGARDFREDSDARNSLRGIRYEGNGLSIEEQDL